MYQGLKWLKPLGLCLLAALALYGAVFSASTLEVNDER